MDDDGIVEDVVEDFEQTQSSSNSFSDLFDTG